MIRSYHARPTSRRMLAAARLTAAIAVVLAGGCVAREPASERNSAAPDSTNVLALAPAAGTTERLLRFADQEFQIVVPAGWVAAPDSAVARIRRGFDPKLMSEHDLVAVLVPEPHVSWDDVPSIRVLVNSHVNTEPRRVLASLKKAMPNLQESMDSITKLTPTWRSASIADPLWDVGRNTLWTVLRASADQGAMYTLGAARMYRKGQISVYYNCRSQRELHSAYELIPDLIDSLGIPKRTDW